MRVTRGVQRRRGEMASSAAPNGAPVGGPAEGGPGAGGGGAPGCAGGAEEPNPAPEAVGTQSPQAEGPAGVGTKRPLLGCSPGLHLGVLHDRCLVPDLEPPLSQDGGRRLRLPLRPQAGVQVVHGIGA